MTINELLVNIYNKDFDILESLEVKHYIPSMEKKMFAMDVISACTDENDGFIAVDRFKMNIYFNIKMLGLYTNLEIAENFDDMIQQYDMLCEHGVLDYVLNLFIDDYKMMCSVLEGELDVLLSQNSIDAQVVRIANKISDAIDSIGNSLDGFDIKTILPEVEDIAEFMNKLK